MKKSETKTKESEMYEEAARLIGRDGWVRGEMGDPTVGYCLMGACSYAAKLFNTTYKTPASLWFICHDIGIIETNDNLLSSQTEAIILLQLAAELAKGGE